MLTNKDFFQREAEFEGYRSRAAYKLKQLQDRFKLLKQGQVVLDLGAAPGGWMQVALEIVGDEGFVLGVDIQPISKLVERNAFTLIADITSALGKKKILERLPDKPDVVLSDVAPSTTGVKRLDRGQSKELSEASLNIAIEFLEKGGTAAIKTFEGQETEELLKHARKHFKSVQRFRPKATKKTSKEVYIVCKGKK